MRLVSLVTSFLLVFGMVFIPTPSKADFSIGISISANIAPPALPVYVQPKAPASNYIWTPGYWAWDSFFEDYYWIPGTWVSAPSPGLLWTPSYWYWRDGQYVYSDGYWGHHIGFYGGINYGFGYGGVGFAGGRWRNGVFINKTVHVTNVTNITNNTANTTTSFNGGPGGIKATPTTQEKIAMKEKHIPATSQQKKQVQAARNNPSLRASVNHGKPAIAATAKPGVFKGKGIVAAKKAGSFYNKTKPIKSRASKTSKDKGTAAARHAGTVHSKAQSHAQRKPNVKKPVVKKPIVKKPKPKKLKPKIPPPQVVPKPDNGQ